MKILLSINPQFVEKIFSGTKKYEYRKAAFRRTDITSVVVYCTAPVMQIVGEFDVDDIICQEPKELWELTKGSSGVDHVFYSKYYSGKSSATAIKIGTTRLFNTPIDPKAGLTPFIAPQSFRYVDDDEFCDPS